jgi:hypothetical protein
MSTIKETILSFQGLEDTPDAFIDRVLALRDLEGDAKYSVDKDTQVCLAAADIYANMCNTADFTENKLSKTYPRSYFRKTAKELYKSYGEPEKADSLTVHVPLARPSNSW